MGSGSIYERAPKKQRRVVVTGVGLVSSCGLTAEESWLNLVNSRSGIQKIDSFDPSRLASQIAGEVRGFDSDLYVPKKEQKKMDRFIHLSLGATEMAMKDSGVEITPEISPYAGVFIGVGIGGLPLIERQHSILREKGPGRISPFFIPGSISNLAPGNISIKYGTKGPNYAVTSACASGAHAIGEAARYIRDGICDVMIAGGAESAVDELTIGGFSSMRALSTRNETPELASRPWDRDRDGFVLSEGAASLVLEDFESASRRGAKIYGEILGYGASSDAFHMTNPEMDGKGAAWAMKLALKDAELSTEQVDYINAHGTSTPAGDEVEANSIKFVFKEHAKKLMVSSTKGATGHALGAAGAIESVICLKALENSVVPPTINLESPSPGCDLDFVPLTAREKNLKVVMNNSFGFGGTNASLVFGAL